MTTDPGGGRPATLVMAGAGGLSLLAVVGVMLLLNQPGEPTVAPAPPPTVTTGPSSPAPSRVVHLELADPADHHNFVELSWSSNEQLDYFVIVMAAGEKTPTALYAHRSNTFRAPVEPTRKYCFQIRGTDSISIYDSPPKPIRGAACQS